MENVFRVVACDEDNYCTPISQSYSDKKDAILQYHFTKDYIKGNFFLLVSEYSIDEEGHQICIHDLTKEEMKHI